MTPATATPSLADEIAAYLERVGGAPCDEITTAVHRLRKTVLHTLLDDSRFVRTGRGRATRWQTRPEMDRNGDETGYVGTNGDGHQPGHLRPPTWEKPSHGSKCSDPVLHRGFNAHYVIDDVRRCIRCDGPPVAPPLMLEEWLSGEGGEDRRNEFEADWDAVLAKTATPEQVERFRNAIGATDEAVNAVAGVM